MGNVTMKTNKYWFVTEAEARSYAAAWLECFRDGYCGTVQVFKAFHDDTWIVETSRLASCD
jgi:hypothetical protein